MSKSRNDKHLSELISPNSYLFEQLKRAISATGSNEIPCAECRRYFPELWEMEKRQEDVPKNLLNAVSHLGTCRECAEEFSMLREAMMHFEHGLLPALPVEPQFDLSFLKATPEPDPIWVEEKIQQVQQLFTDVRIIINQATASFGSLSAPLAAKPALAGHFRSIEPEIPVEVLVLPASDAQLSVHLSIGPLSDGKAAIAIKLLETENDSPLPGRRVMLRNARKQLLVGSITGQDGSTVFEHLSAGRYFIQVQHNEQSWQVPVVIVSGETPWSHDDSDP